MGKLCHWVFEIIGFRGSFVGLFGFYEPQVVRVMIHETEFVKRFEIFNVFEFSSYEVEVLTV